MLWNVQVLLKAFTQSMYMKSNIKIEMGKRL